MTIRIYNDKIRFVADSDNDTDIDLLIESDGLRFTGTLTTAFNVPYANAPPQVPQPPPNPQGTVAGFTSGGNPAPTTPENQLKIDKFPFSISAGTATNVGSLNTQRYNHIGHSSDTDGFSAGGISTPVPGTISSIDKFPFSIDAGTATDVGDMSALRSSGGAQSSGTDGFIAGGFEPVVPGNVSTIDKFPFSIDAGTATDVGDLSQARANITGISSITDGFNAGGSTPSTVYTIDKFPFAISSGTATDVGDLSLGSFPTSVGRNGAAPGASSTNGYTAGGSEPNRTSTIDKFPFAISGGTATDVGDLSSVRNGLAGQSSTTDGFTSGGTAPPSISTIDKFPFSIDAGTATDVGDLSSVRTVLKGHQD